MKVTVIICFYNRLNLLPACLDALRACAADFHEVVIADDGSSAEVVEKLKELIRNYDFPIIHAWHPRNGSRRSATRNNGIRHSTGDYLVFIDADFALLPGAIHSHVKVARLGFFAAGRCKYTTMEQCRTILAEGPSEYLLNKIYSEISDEQLDKEHRRFLRHSLLRRFLLTPARKIVFGGHFSAFKKDIEAVNGYDENFVGWGGEDVDFATRMVRRGFRGTSVIKSAKVLHMWHPSEMSGLHWTEGDNMKYFSRSKIDVVCENGLTHRVG